MALLLLSCCRSSFPLCQDHLQTAHSLSVWFGYKGRQTGHSGLVSVILGGEDSAPGSLPRLGQGSAGV